MDKITSEYVDYLTKMGAKGSVKTNLTPKEIKEVKEKIKNSEERMMFLTKSFKKIIK
jgi:hypothetical protein